MTPYLVLMAIVIGAFVFASFATGPNKSRRIAARKRDPFIVLTPYDQYRKEFVESGTRSAYEAMLREVLPLRPAVWYEDFPETIKRVDSDWRESVDGGVREKTYDDWTGEEYARARQASLEAYERHMRNAMRNAKAMTW